MREAISRVRLEDGADYVVIASEEVNRVEFRRLVDWIESAASEE
jgi:hypothetical protein